jgi:signal transduction histidine kinase/ligand-binding sensor domain-containing protein
MSRSSHRSVSHTYVRLRHWIRALCAATCCSAGIVCSNAQPLTVPEGFQHVTTKQGLSDASVTAILRDRCGFIWFGTSDGLNRFDGVDMDVFRHVKGDSSSLAGNWVRMLFEDSRGDIWIGLQDLSLSRYVRAQASFRNYPHEKREGRRTSDGIVTAMCEDRSRRLWKANFYSGISIFDSLQAKFVPTAIKAGAHQRPLEFIRTLARDSLGRMWAGSFKHGLFTCDTLQQTWASYQWNDTSLGGNTIKEIVVAHDGVIWVATWGGGLKRIDPASGAVTTLRAHPGARPELCELTNDFILSLAEDRHGRIWIGFPGNGIDIYDPSTGAWTHHHHLPNDPTSLNHNIITILTCAPDNTMWIGTDAGGASYLSPYPKPFHFLATAGMQGSGVKGVAVQATLCDSHGDLWIGTGSEGVLRVPRGTSHAISYLTGEPGHSSLRENAVTAIIEDRNGVLWVGKMNGVCRFDREQNRFREVAVELSNEQEKSHVTSFRRHRDGTLWVSTYGQGVIALDPVTGRTHRFRHLDNDSASLRSDYFYTVAFAGTDDIWLGSYMMGLQKMNMRSGRTTKFSGRAEGLSLGELTVTSLLADDHGRLWLGTHGDGLVVLDTLGGFIARYGEGEGLQSNIVGGIAQDAHGYVWIGTLRGLSRCDPERRTFRTFDERDGLAPMGFGNVSERQGWLFFGGDEGLVWFHPDSIHDDPGPIPTVITEVKVLDQSLAPNHPVDQTAPLSLTYTQNDIAFEFAALNYRAPSASHYEYRLDGLDTRWKDGGSRRYVHYTNLDPGEYVFRVRGRQGDETGGSSEATLHLHIAPPYWRAWWFTILAAGVLIAAVVLLVRWRFERLRRAAALQVSLTRQILASQDEERKRIGSSLHDSLGQNLLLIKNFAALALSGKSTKEDEHAQMEEISSLAMQAIGEVREIAYDLHPYQLDRLGLTGALQSMCSRIAGSTTTRFSVELDNVDGLIAKDQEIHVYRIAQESINNIVRHARAAHAAIRMARNGNRVVLTVQDDGAGFVSGVEGFGISGMRERTKILRGTLSVDSTPGKGTTVQAEFLLEEHH